MTADYLACPALVLPGQFDYGRDFDINFGL